MNDPKQLKVSDFDFELPTKLIAQKPAAKRDQSRLLVYNRQQNKITHTQFNEITNFIPKDALIVFNNSKVYHARIFANDQNGTKIELLLTKSLNTTQTKWRALVKPGRKCKPGTILSLPEDIRIKIEAVNNDGSREITTDQPLAFSYLEKHGQLPLPPYITSNYNKQLASRYQTNYAKQTGSIAAPTAGLHFSQELLSEIKKQFKTAEITLHVGLGTFAPLRENNVTDNDLHSENYNISAEAAELLNQHHQNELPIITVGTTSTRVLEAQITEFSEFRAGDFSTNIFIYPSKQFQAISGLITNFHLPKSSLFIMISTLLGIDQAQAVYQEAIKEQYRFYSFGDACLFI